MHSNSQNWTSYSASDPKDEANYDKDSMFNKFKHGRKWVFKKNPKVYKKYTPGDNSTFNPKNRGFQARPDLFKSRYFSHFNIRIYNPFTIRDWSEFKKEPTSQF